VLRKAAQIPQVFREAFRIAREGRPGPVLIDLPLNVQRGEVEYDPDIDAPLEVVKPSPDARRIRRAMEMLLKAKRPILMMGGGVMLARASQQFVGIGGVSPGTAHSDLHGRGRHRLRPPAVWRAAWSPDQHAEPATSCS